MSQSASLFRPNAIFAFSAACVILSLAAPARADIIFNNITSPCCGGLAVEGTNFSAESVAAPFTPTFTDHLDFARVVVFQALGFGGDPAFNMSLFSDTGGAPGSLIEEFGPDLTAPIPNGGIVAASSTLNPVLLTGTQYWLVLTPFDSNTQVGWGEGGSQFVPTYVTTSPTGAGGWISAGSTNVQYEIVGTAPSTVPEPASAALLATALGLAAVVLKKGRRKPIVGSQ